MTRIYTAIELARLKKIKVAVIKVNAEKKVETRRRIEEIQHEKQNNKN